MVCAQFNKSTSAASSSMGSPFGGNWAETSLFRHIRAEVPRCALSALYFTNLLRIFKTVESGFCCEDGAGKVLISTAHLDLRKQQKVYNPRLFTGRMRTLRRCRQSQIASSQR